MRARTSSLRLVSWVEVGEQRVRPALQRARRSGGGSSARDTPNALWVAADLVQRDQPVVDVEGGVLDALGHDRAGQSAGTSARTQLQPLGLPRSAGSSASSSSTSRMKSKTDARRPGSRRRAQAMAISIWCAVVLRDRDVAVM